MAKEIVNIPNIDASKAIEILGSKFSHSIEADSKGRLVIYGDFVKVFVKFKKNGSTTELKFGGSRWVSGGMIARIIFIPFYWIYANLKASGEHKSLLKDLANSIRTSNTTPSSTDDVSAKISKLKKMKEQGIISEEEFNKKKSELIEKL